MGVEISQASRVVAVSFYQLILIALGGMLICRLVPEGELGYGWHNNLFGFSLVWKKIESRVVDCIVMVRKV